VTNDRPDPKALRPFTRFLVRRRTAFSWVAPLVLLAVARPWAPLVAVGAGLALVGASLRLWAAGTLVKSERLTTGGPYVFMRNPLYFGSLLICLGYCAASGLWWSYPVFLGLFAVFYIPTILWEEEFLRNKFGEDYQEYARRVPRFFPRLTPAYRPESGFRWEQLRANRELQGAALTGTMIMLFALRLLL